MNISSTNAHSANTDFNQMFSNSIANGESKKQLNDAKAALNGGGGGYRALIAAMGEMADNRLNDALSAIEQLDAKSGGSAGGATPGIGGGNGSTGGTGGDVKPSDTMKAQVEVQLAMGDIQGDQKAAEAAAQTYKSQRSGQ